MLRRRVYFQPLLLATALVVLLPGCSTINGWLGDKDRNELQTVDGPRRKPVMNPTSASQIMTGEAPSTMRYDGYVPPPYTAEPIPTPNQTYVAPGGYYNVPLPNIEPQTPAFLDTPKTTMEPMAYETAIDAKTGKDLHAKRKPLPRIAPAAPVATVAAQLTPLIEPPIIREKPAQLPVPVAAPANSNININTYSVRSETVSQAQEVDFSWFENLFDSGEAAPKQEHAEVPQPQQLARADDYPSLHSVPPTPPALGEAKRKGPAAREDLNYEGWVAKQKKRQLNDEVEADKPNSLREEMERNNNNNVPVTPPSRPQVNLPPPTAPRNAQSYMLPEFAPNGRGAPAGTPELKYLATSSMPQTRGPSIAARGVLVSPWYMPAASISVGVIARAIDM